MSADGGSGTGVSTRLALLRQARVKPVAVTRPSDGRLAKLRAHAEARGPVEMPLEEDDMEDGQRRLVFPALPPLDPSKGEIVFAPTPEERSRLADECAGLDCETFLIQSGRNTPRLVVTGYQAANGQQAIITGDPHDPTVHARAFLAFTDRIVRDHFAGIGCVLINQIIAFDFAVIAEDAHQADIALGKVGVPDSLFEAVMSRIFEMLDLNLVEDTMLRERLIDLAEGTLGKDFDSLTEKGNPRRKSYALKPLAQKYLGVDLDKFTYRTGYAKYINRPIEDYEPGAVDYLTDDVESALHVAARQTKRAQLHGLPVGSRIPNSAVQTNAAFSLQLVSSWGMRTSLEKVQKLDADLDRQARSLLRVLQEAGIVRTSGRDAGTQDMKRTKALVQQAYEEAGLHPPRTKSGKNISTAGAVLEDIALMQLRGSSADILDEHGRIDEAELFKLPLYAASQHASITKLRTTYLPVLYMGTQHPINTRFETILETGRISSYKPNLNNIPRGGIKTLLQRLQARVRQCFVPRPGYLFCSVDYSMLELCTLAQCLIWFFNGQSKMADAINDGYDLHTLFAAEQLLHIPYEEARQRVKAKDKEAGDMRQLAKVGNFGLGGGMGAESLTEFAKATYNVFISIDEARALKEKWLTQFPEMRAYFRLIGSMMRGFDDKGQTVGDMEQFVSGRIRGRTRYCAMANGFFQGLAADGAKSALNALQRACYLQRGALYGSRVVAFFYDEFFMEHPEETAAERARIQAEIAKEKMQEICTDVKIGAEPALQKCWYKEAEAVYDSHGRLIPWEPHAKEF